MIPPCAQNVLQSFGSAVLVTSRTLIPALARQNEAVSPAMPVPRTTTGKWERFWSATRSGLYALRYDERDVVAERSAPRPHGVENLLRARPGGERLMKSRLAPHLPARAQRLGDAVGVEHQRVSVGDRSGALRVGRFRETAEEGAVRDDLLD